MFPFKVAVVEATLVAALMVIVEERPSGKAQRGSWPGCACCVGCLSCKVILVPGVRPVMLFKKTAIPWG